MKQVLSTITCGVLTGHQAVSASTAAETSPAEWHTRDHPALFACIINPDTFSLAPLGQAPLG